MTRRILFLGYDRNATRLIDSIAKTGAEVQQTADPVDDFSAFELVVSFGYRHIIQGPVLATAKRPLINLHVSLLPWNRGAHPNFWSFAERTPAGVTIHEIDEGLDTGAVIFNREVRFDTLETTFRQTQARLISEIESLFEENIDALLSGDYVARAQPPGGSYHRKSQLPAGMVDWDGDIETTLVKLGFR